MSKLQKISIQQDDWHALKAFTAARIALGSTGVSLPLKAVLELRLAHARAKDAIYASLNTNGLHDTLMHAGLAVYNVHSQVANRDDYLQRPDLGRMLQEDSRSFLKALTIAPADIAIIIADGLSATAVNTYARPFIEALRQQLTARNYTVAPVVLATMARVAIGDEIGCLLKSRLTIILIGERPGLSAFDSMGAYITYNPRPGTTDERRNCVSNIRDEGLSPVLAAQKAIWIVDTAFQLQLTGVQLKDHGESGLPHVSLPPELY